MATDTTDRQALAHAGTQIRARFEHLDVVVLNAGTCEYVDAADWDSELFERVMRTNFQGTVNCIEQALPLLQTVNDQRGLILVLDRVSQKVGDLVRIIGEFGEILRKDLLDLGDTVSRDRKSKAGNAANTNHSRPRASQLQANGRVTRVGDTPENIS